MESWGFEPIKEAVGDKFSLLDEGGVGGFGGDHGGNVNFGGAGGVGGVGDIPPAHVPLDAPPPAEDSKPPEGDPKLRYSRLQFLTRPDAKKPGKFASSLWKPDGKSLYDVYYHDQDGKDLDVSPGEAKEIIDNAEKAAGHDWEKLTQNLEQEGKKGKKGTSGSPVDPERLVWVYDDKGNSKGYSWAKLQAIASSPDPVSDAITSDLKKSAQEAKETTERLKKQLAQLKLMMEGIDTGTLEGLRAFLTLFKTVMRDVANMMESSVKKISIAGQDKVTASHQRLSDLYRKIPEKADKKTAGLNADIEQERGYQQSVTNMIETAMSFARSIMTDTEALEQGVEGVIAGIDRYFIQGSRSGMA